ncbi:MAG: hypothetical protein QXO70_02905 [Candidatus Pacearchaeota archaeon]
MISYNDLYELLRKEKFSEGLQSLPKNFLEEFSEYINERREQSSVSGDFFTDALTKTKKQLENSIALFKELMTRRKKKLLNLVFVAAETGIMKRDYENMLGFERELFEKLVKAFEEEDKEIGKVFNGKRNETENKNKMIIFKQNVEQFVDMFGNVIGPFTSGELANLDAAVCDVLVASGKATFVDEK